MFLGVCNERHVDNLFLATEPFVEKFYPEIKELLLKYTLKFNITHTVERTLNKIIRQDGFSEVLVYLEGRFLFKRKLVVEKKNLLGYDFVPTHTGNTITHDLSEGSKIEIFREALKWFVEFDYEPYEIFYAKNIVELFAIQKFIDDKLYGIYIEFIHKYCSEYKRLLNIIDSLSEFKEKNEAFVGLIIRLLEVSFENFQDEEQLNEITAQCYIALTSLGAKCGAPGQPFAADIELKELLEKTLGNSNVRELRDRVEECLGFRLSQ